MTVTYTSQVADCKGFGCFWKLLFRWKGSIYKLVWTDLLAYSVFYFLLSAIYRVGLGDEGKRMFEKISLYTDHFTQLIPISFVLGFYVSIVVQRWWSQFECLPWPDSLSLYISTSIPGNDDKGRMMRRTIMRYANLAFTLTLIMISPRIKKRFPTLDHLIEAGLLTANEKKIFDDLSAKTSHTMYWMPFVWAGAVVARARKEGRIRDDFATKTIIDEMNRLRGLCGSLLAYDWISIPLVYTQVVTLAVYTFFLATLMGRQFLDPAMNYEKHNLDIVFPIFTYLQFFFYMGWLKVAESLVNPFGEDDDDFEINWIIDRNVQVSYLIVDEMHNEHPELIQDIYWDEVFPTELPYTIAAQEFRTEPPQGSTANLEVPAEEQELLPMLEEETKEDLLEVNSDNPSTSIRNSNMKQIGSNLSNMLHPATNLLPKSSFLSFLHRSTSSVQKPSYKKSLQRIPTKSSGITMSPGTSNRRESHVYQMSEVSFSGSESCFPDHHHLHSSKDSINTDTNSFSSRRKHRQRKTTMDDDGIHFIIKKRYKDEFRRDRPPDNEERDSEHLDEYNEIPVGTLIEHKKKKRTISDESANSFVDSERQKTANGREASAGSAPPKLIDHLKPYFSSRNSSSSSLRDQTIHRLPLQSGRRKRSRSSSSHKTSQYSELQAKKPFLRGPFFWGLSSSFESRGAGGQSTPPPTRAKFTPATDTIINIPPTNADSSQGVVKEATISSATGESPVTGSSLSNAETFTQNEREEHRKESKNSSDDHTKIWL